MSDRDDELIQAYARGEATEAELREIARRLESDDAAARELAARLSDETLLAGWFRAEADPGFVEETAAVAGTAKNDPEFLDRTLQRIDRRRRSLSKAGAPSSFSTAIAAVAALLLIGFGLLLWSSLSPTPPRSPAIALPKTPAAPIEPPLPPTPKPAPIPESRPPLVVPTPVPKPAPPEVPPTETPRPTPRPPDPPPAPPAPAPRETVVAIARFDRVEGTVSLLSSEGRTSVTAPSDLPPGRSIEIGKPGRALLRYPDGTSLDLGPGTRIDELTEAEGGKRLTLQQGTVTAEVAKQPAGRAFVIQTPQAEARVVGTTLKLSVEGGSTRLDVTEGRVRLTRPDKKSVEVVAGHFAVAAPGGDLASRTIEGFTLKDIPAQGLALWLRADAGITTLGDGVSSWADQSGGRRDAVQEIAARRPKLVPDVLRSRPAIRFDGADDVLTTSLPIEGLSGLTLVLVAANSQDYSGGAVHGENAAIFWPESVDWGWVYLSPFQSNVKFRFGTTQANNLPFHIRAATTAAFTLTTCVKDGAVETLYVQGAPVERYAGKGPAIKGTLPALQIGSGARNQGYPGDIAEVLVYTRALSEAERQRLERALLGKYFR